MTKLPDSSAASSSPPPANAASEESDTRRDFMAEAGAIGIGAVVGLTPLVAGAITFVDPLSAKKYPAGANSEAAFVPLTRLDNLVDGGPPQQFPVKQDRVDAWTFSQEPVGAVYLSRIGNDVVAFNAVCPHAGCFVGFDAAQQKFICPCHDSAFGLKGERSEHSPSQRDLDMLEVEVDKATGEVKVKFQNFLTGKKEKTNR